jgi:hypothetical protein
MHACMYVHVCTYTYIQENKHKCMYICISQGIEAACIGKTSCRDLSLLVLRWPRAFVYVNVQGIMRCLFV